ncbi:hypothetical protein DAMDJJ_07725 [Cupriavidus necator]
MVVAVFNARPGIRAVRHTDELVGMGTRIWVVGCGPARRLNLGRPHGIAASYQREPSECRIQQDHRQEDQITSRPEVAPADLEALPKALSWSPKKLRFRQVGGTVLHITSVVFPLLLGLFQREHLLPENEGTNHITVRVQLCRFHRRLRWTAYRCTSGAATAMFQAVFPSRESKVECVHPWSGASFLGILANLNVKLKKLCPFLLHGGVAFAIRLLAEMAARGPFERGRVVQDRDPHVHREEYDQERPNRSANEN